MHGHPSLNMPGKFTRCQLLNTHCLLPEWRQTVSATSRHYAGRQSMLCKAIFLLQAWTEGTFDSPELPPGGVLNFCTRSTPLRNDSSLVGVKKKKKKKKITTLSVPLDPHTGFPVWNISSTILYRGEATDGTIYLQGLRMLDPVKKASSRCVLYNVWELCFNWWMFLLTLPLVTSFPASFVVLLLSGNCNISCLEQCCATVPHTPRCKCNFSTEIIK